MIRNVKIGEREIPMLSMASVDLYYRNIFHEDPIKLQSKADPDEGDIIDFVMKMGFVMAKFAELHDRKKMTALTEDAYLDWMDGFERSDYLSALLDIKSVYEGQTVTTSDAKKKDDRPSGK